MYMVSRWKLDGAWLPGGRDTMEGSRDRRVYFLRWAMTMCIVSQWSHVDVYGSPVGAIQWRVPEIGDVFSSMGHDNVYGFVMVSRR